MPKFILFSPQCESPSFVYRSHEVVHVNINTIYGRPCQATWYMATHVKSHGIWPPMSSHMVYGHPCQVTWYMAAHVKSHGIWPPMSSHMVYGRPCQATWYMATHVKSHGIWPPMSSHMVYGRPCQATWYMAAYVKPDSKACHCNPARFNFQCGHEAGPSCWFLIFIFMHSTFLLHILSDSVHGELFQFNKLINWHLSYVTCNSTKHFHIKNITEPCHEKTLFCHMRTTKAQISLRIRAVWSAPLLFTSLIV